jgi:hypothetical protein
MAFLLRSYGKMLSRMRENGYRFLPILACFENGEQVYDSPTIFLRHDVDRHPRRAVAMARLEKKLDIASTYYVRSDSKGGFNAGVVRELSSLGHEVGYHYECMSRARGDGVRAKALFVKDLAELRTLVQVKTISAHGAPLSRHSNMDWSISPADHDLLGEPQKDFDYKKVLYITDTGGIFGSPHNLRDWSPGKNLSEPTPLTKLADRLSPQEEPFALISTHPERWPRGIIAVWLQTLLDFGINQTKHIRRKLRP